MGWSYRKSFSVSVDKTRFIESDNVPSDSRKVGSTWQYVNKNGSPDRRFKNNYQIPIMEYGEIFITGKGLTISLHISKLEAAFAFVKRIEEFQSTVRPQTIESVKARFNEITNHHKTLEKITHIVHSSPITVQDLIKRAEARVQSDDKLGAVTDLTEAIRLDPNDAVIYYMRGMLRKELGDSIGADDDFQKVIGM
jgi:tetratricopeptide (TPR) repeat protein